MRCSVLRLRCLLNTSPMRNALALCILLFAVSPNKRSPLTKQFNKWCNAGLANAQFRAVARPPRRGGPDASDGSSKKWFLLVVGACRGAGKHRQRQPRCKFLEKRTANTKKVAADLRDRNSKAPKITCAKRFSCTHAMRKPWSCWPIDGCAQPRRGSHRHMYSWLPAWIRILFRPTSVWRTFPAN